MRAIDPALQAALDGGATTLCRCWSLRRRDGLVLGFTDHDDDLGFDDLVFRANSGLTGSALETSLGLSVDNAEVSGALSDAAINEDDIRAGRFDGAEVDQWLVDWQAPARRVLLFRGTIGEIRRADGAFDAELRGLAEALNVPVGRTIKATCDRVLGDRKCGVALDVPAFLHESVVVESEGERIVGAAAGGFADDWFAFGVLRFTSGANEGLAFMVRRDSAAGGRRVFVLAEAPRLRVRPGDAFRVTAGCDRRGETCRVKFANFLNFRGFPHIPGEDWVVAYPRSGEAHDGSSRARG
jgi:uncharacterized phage protein (TIGR02218 family)